MERLGSAIRRPRCYSNDGDYEQSIELIRDTPSDVYSKEFDYLLAHDLGRMQKQAEAIDVLEMLRKNNPEDPWILCESAGILAQLEIMIRLLNYLKKHFQSKKMHTVKLCWDGVFSILNNTRLHVITWQKLLN